MPLTSSNCSTCQPINSPPPPPFVVNEKVQQPWPQLLRHLPTHTCTLHTHTHTHMYMYMYYHTYIHLGIFMYCTHTHMYTHLIILGLQLLFKPSSSGFIILLHWNGLYTSVHNIHLETHTQVSINRCTLIIAHHENCNVQCMPAGNITIHVTYMYMTCNIEVTNMYESIQYKYILLRPHP